MESLDSSRIRSILFNMPNLLSVTRFRLEQVDDGEALAFGH